MSATIFIVLGLLLVILLFSLFRRRSNPSKYPEVVQYVIWDIRLNQALVDAFRIREKPRYFEKNNWNVNKDKIGFLSETLKESLRETFKLVDEYNAIIKASKKNRDDSYKSIDLAHFKELLAKCRQELEDWMEKTIGKKELPTKYPTLASFFLGDR